MSQLVHSRNAQDVVVQRSHSYLAVPQLSLTGGRHNKNWKEGGGGVEDVDESRRRKGDDHAPPLASLLG